jgi:type II secretory pathway component GspD/PulD (secretin)
VRIRNGDTLVVGGLIDRTDEETLRRVPILADVPFLGGAFKNKETSNSASELIVFVTPRILEEPSEAQLAATAPSPLGLREQEPAGARQEVIEAALNALEPSL